MKFCEVCGNLLIPKRGQFYCQTCDKYTEIPLGERKLTKELNHEEYNNEVIRIDRETAELNKKLFKEENDKRMIYDLKFDES